MVEVSGADDGVHRFQGSCQRGLERVPAQHRCRSCRYPSVSADHLCPCGLSAVSPAPRCRACPAQPPSAAFEAAFTGTRTAEPAQHGSLMTYSRWKKSAGTFGPTGRIVATFLLLLPLPLLAMAIATGIGIIGAGIYIVLIMPWALKDIWRKAGTPVQPPQQVGVRPRF
jgi:hypothetical protein